MPRLTEADFKATMGDHPEKVDLETPPPVEFWAYFDAIPLEDFGGFDFTAGEVSHAWNMPGGRHQHVLVRCPDPDVFLVLVLDLIERQVYGHHLLDLPRLYGRR
ncbi:hypothetical protein [Spirillospora sp. NPDC048819]|uniref:hypothetical protein n=1 Tax=Spirillospora sp. NPDC048819 TaxID=3155268 RepID=UPI0033FDF5E3